jgi:hypothetical protein
VNRDIPHLNIVIGVCIVAVAGYALFSVYAVIWLRDATMTGDIIGTWKSFAVAAFAFWLGSSSGGKRQDMPTTEPQPVTVVNPPGDPVNVDQQQP